MAVLLKIPFSVRIKTVCLLQVKLHLPNRPLSCSRAHIRILPQKRRWEQQTWSGVYFKNLADFPWPSVFQKESVKALSDSSTTAQSPGCALGGQAASDGCAFCLQVKSSSSHHLSSNQDPSRVLNCSSQWTASWGRSCALTSTCIVSDRCSLHLILLK